jgi:hypothetical protein
MLRNAISFILIRQNFAIAMTQVIVLGLIALPLAGCGADGSGGPVISSLSPPTDTQSDDPQPSDDTPSDSTQTAMESPADEAVGEDLTISMLTDETVNTAEDFDSAAGPEGPAVGEEDPTISVTSTPTGATARLTWDVSPDPTVSNYHVYYGKESSGEPGSCSYEESQAIESPPAIITGLEPNTPYFFAISASGGEGGESESPCSNEVLVVTPPAQS